MARLAPGVCVRSRTRSTAGAVLCMPNEMRVNPAARRSASIRSSTLSGFASVVTSASASSPNSARMASSTCARPAAPSRVGVPPPTNTVVDRTGLVAERARCEPNLVRQHLVEGVTPDVSPSSVAVYVLKSQYPQRLEQKGTWTYTPSARPTPRRAVRRRGVAAPKTPANSPLAGKTYFLGASDVDSAAMKASWGTSTRPTIFMRFLPSFCFSSSLRLRLMSPP